MSLFESSITGNVLNDGSTTEISGITAGQLATVLTAYTPQVDTAANTAAIGINTAGVANNAAAIAALQTQVDNLPAPAPPDLAPYALASDLAAAEGLIAANASSITALNTSLTTGLAGKANQSALDALQLQVDAKSGKRRRQAGELLRNGGHEFGHHQRQQRNPGQRGLELRPSNGNRPAGFGSRRQAVWLGC